MAGKRNVITSVVKLLSLAVTSCCTYAGATPGEFTPLVGAGVEVLGNAAGEVLGSAIYDLLHKHDARSRDLLQHESVVELAGEAIKRSFDNIARDFDEEHSGVQKLKECVARAQSNWRSLVTEQHRARIEQSLDGTVEGDFEQWQAARTGRVGRFGRQPHAGL